MLTIIRCKDCGETMAYSCTQPLWKCAKCGKSHPHVMPMAPRRALKIKKAKEKPFA